MVRKSFANACARTQLCKFHVAGVCSNGEACMFAHRPEEIQPMVDLTRTKFCPLLALNGVCVVPSCRYAHSRSELREDPRQVAQPEGGATSSLNWDLVQAAVRQSQSTYDGPDAHGGQQAPSSSGGRFPEEASATPVRPGLPMQSTGTARNPLPLPCFVDEPFVPPPPPPPPQDPRTVELGRGSGSGGVHAFPPLLRSPEPSALPAHASIFAREEEASGAWAQETPPPPHWAAFPEDFGSLGPRSINRMDSLGSLWPTSSWNKEPLKVRAPQIETDAPPEDPGAAPADGGAGQAGAQPKIRRRFFKTKMCRYIADGTCKRDGKCNFAHSEEELMPTPDLRFTKLCTALLLTGSCSAGQECTFAHDTTQLRVMEAQASQNSDDIEPSGASSSVQTSIQSNFPKRASMDTMATSSTMDGLSPQATYTNLTAQTSSRASQDAGTPSMGFPSDMDIFTPQGTPSNFLSLVVRMSSQGSQGGFSQQAVSGLAAHIGQEGGAPDRFQPEEDGLSRQGTWDSFSPQPTSASLAVGAGQGGLALDRFQAKEEAPVRARAASLSRLRPRASSRPAQEKAEEPGTQLRVKNTFLTLESEERMERPQRSSSAPGRLQAALRPPVRAASAAPSETDTDLDLEEALEQEFDWSRGKSAPAVLDPYEDREWQEENIYRGALSSQGSMRAASPAQTPSEGDLSRQATYRSVETAPATTFAQAVQDLECLRAQLLAMNGGTLRRGQEVSEEVEQFCLEHVNDVQRLLCRVSDEVQWLRERVGRACTMVPAEAAWVPAEASIARPFIAPR